MTVTHNTVGAVNQGGSSCAPAFSAFVGVAEAAVLFSGWGNPEGEPPATPDGFTLLGHQLGGAGTFTAADNGPRGMSAFYRITDGTEDSQVVNLTNGGSGNQRVMTGQIVQATKTAAEWFISAVKAPDDTNDNSFSIAPETDPGPAVAGDLIYSGSVWRPDSVTPVTPVINYPGMSSSGTTQVQSIANTNGYDQRFFIYRRNLTGGPSTGAPSFAMSPASAVSGAGILVLLHDGEALPPPTGLSGWGITL